MILQNVYRFCQYLNIFGFVLISLYTHILGKTFVLFTLIFHHTGESRQDLFLYHYGSFHSRIFYQLSCRSFREFKDMKNKFPGGRHAKGHETRKHDI